MFGDAFIEEGDIFNGQVLSVQQSRAKNCADELDMPDRPREGSFMGLRNQGATCYLNSLIQACYMSPEFRNTILSLPLCKQTIQEKSEFVGQQSKHNFLLAFQKLFAALKYVDCTTVVTEELTKSFGWEDQDAVQQQDVQEANRIIFDTLDRALEGTIYREKLTGQYRGTFWSHITCLQCEYQNGREESFYDLMLYIKGNKNLEESLMQLITPERLENDNKYFCELCQKKCDALRGTKIRKLPSILTISLSRFDWDLVTFERKKLNDHFEFGLELDLRNFTETEQNDAQYELQSVIIHMGSAQGGHYHAYIRDLLKEGNHHLIKEILNQESQDQSKNDNLKKKNKNKKQQQENTNQKYYDNDDFPIPAQNQELYQNWFDFNDGSVTPISVNKLSKQFGGSESAYILIYRKIGLNPEGTQINQNYLQSYYNEVNSQKQKEREIYDEAKQTIQLYITNKDIVNFETRKLPEKWDFKTDFCEFKLKVSVKIQDLLLMVKERLKITEKFSLLEIWESHINRIVQLRRYLSKDFNFDQTLEEIQVNHYSTWIVVNDEDLEFKNSVQEIVGEDKIPIRVNILYQGESKPQIVFLGESLIMLKQRFEKEYGISVEKQFIKNLTLQKLLEGNDKTLGELGVGDQSDLMIERISENTENNKGEQIQGNEEQPGDNNYVSILVERDDEYGINRYFININQTLESLYQDLRIKLGLENDDKKRRLKKLLDNSLFCSADYKKYLTDLGFFEGGIRLKLERGEVPENGKIGVRYKVQSDLKTQTQEEILNDQYFEYVCDPSLTVFQLKYYICATVGLQAQDHKLYRTDWLEDPIEHISKENLTLTQALIRQGNLLILKDNATVVKADFDRFQIYFSDKGKPDDSRFINDVSVKRNLTVGELKNLLLNIKELNPNAETDINKLRVRELRKDFFYGQVLKKNDKSLSRYQFTTKNLLCQFLSQAEELSEDNILLVAKHRNIQDRIYEKPIEFDFSSPFTIQNLKQIIIKSAQLDVSIDDIELSKFTAHEFLWIRVDQAEYEKHLQQTKKTNKSNDQKGKHKKQTKNQSDDEQNGIINLKKQPFLLKEGDYIGYWLRSEISNIKDDLQTKEDKEFRLRMLETRRKKGKDQPSSRSKKNDNYGFQVKVDF